MKRVLVTGGTGFIGKHLVDALADRGDAVGVFTREKGPDDKRPGVRRLVWDPERAGNWYLHVAAEDAVVHLAGEQAVGKRYTDEQKKRILDSRVESTKRIVEAIGRAKQRPKVLVCASGVDYYAPTELGEPIDEQAAAGSDFLAQVCVEWEAAARGAEAFGVRVVHARFGMVLGPDGGALEQMALPFRLFVGGKIGKGDQAVSWVYVDDAVGILLRAIDDAAITGPVNVVAPSAVTNHELARAIGRVLGRPSFMPAPAFALRLMFGNEGSKPILTGRHVVPEVMRQHGYVWQQPELEGALTHALKR